MGKNIKLLEGNIHTAVIALGVHLAGEKVFMKTMSRFTYIQSWNKCNMIAYNYSEQYRNI